MLQLWWGTRRKKEEVNITRRQNTCPGAKVWGSSTEGLELILGRFKKKKKKDSMNRAETNWGCLGEKKWRRTEHNEGSRLSTHEI